MTSSTSVSSLIPFQAATSALLPIENVTYYNFANLTKSGATKYNNTIPSVNDELRIRNQQRENKITITDATSTDIYTDQNFIKLTYDNITADILHEFKAGPDITQVTTNAQILPPFQIDLICAGYVDAYFGLEEIAFNADFKVDGKYIGIKLDTNATKHTLTVSYPVSSTNVTASVDVETNYGITSLTKALYKILITTTKVLVFVNNVAVVNTSIDDLSANSIHGFHLDRTNLATKTLNLYSIFIARSGDFSLETIIADEFYSKTQIITGSNALVENNATNPVTLEIQTGDGLRILNNKLEIGTTIGDANVAGTTSTTSGTVTSIDIFDATNGSVDNYYVNWYITIDSEVRQITAHSSGIVTVASTTFTTQGYILKKRIVFTNDVVVGGDLIVTGNTTTNTANMLIEDNLLIINDGSPVLDKDAGVLVRQNGTTNLFGWIYDKSATTPEIVLGSFSDDVVDGSGNLSINDYIPLHVGGLTVDDTSTINGATIIQSNDGSLIVKSLTGNHIALDVVATDGSGTGRVGIGASAHATSNLQVTGTTKITGATDIGGALGVTGVTTCTSNITLKSDGGIFLVENNTGTPDEVFKVTANAQASLSNSITQVINGQLILPASDKTPGDGNAQIGSIRYNTTSSNLEVYSNALWEEVSGGSGSGTGTGLTGNFFDFSSSLKANDLLRFQDQSGKSLLFEDTKLKWNVDNIILETGEAQDIAVALTFNQIKFSATSTNILQSNHNKTGYYIGMKIEGTEAPIDKEIRTITTYNGTTKVATVSPPFSTDLNATTPTYQIRVNKYETRTAQDIGSSSTTTLKLATIPSTISQTKHNTLDFYKGAKITFTGGAGTAIGKSRIITGSTAGADPIITFATVTQDLNTFTPTYVITFNINESGTGVAIGSSTTTQMELAATATSTFEAFHDQNDFYNGCIIQVTSGTSSGDIRTIIDYDGTSHEITVTPDFTTDMNTETPTYVITNSLTLNEDFIRFSHNVNDVTLSELNLTGTDDILSVPIVLEFKTRGNFEMKFGLENAKSGATLTFGDTSATDSYILLSLKHNGIGSETEAEANDPEVTLQRFSNNNAVAINMINDNGMGKDKLTNLISTTTYIDYNILTGFGSALRHRLIIRGESILYYINGKEINLVNNTQLAGDNELVNFYGIRWNSDAEWFEQDIYQFNLFKLVSNEYLGVTQLEGADLYNNINYGYSKIAEDAYIGKRLVVGADNSDYLTDTMYVKGNLIVSGEIHVNTGDSNLNFGTTIDALQSNIDTIVEIQNEIISANGFYSSIAVQNDMYVGKRLVVGNSNDDFLTNAMYVQGNLIVSGEFHVNTGESNLEFGSTITSIQSNISNVINTITNGRDLSVVFNNSNHIQIAGASKNLSILTTDATPGFTIDMNDRTDGIRLPQGNNTGEKVTSDASSVGVIRYNSETRKFQGVAETGSPGTYVWVDLSVAQA